MLSASLIDNSRWWGLCSTLETVAILRLEADEDVALWGVWRAVGGRVDYGRLADGYVAADDEDSGFGLVLGRPSVCAPSNFDVSEDDHLLGIRGFDLSGNPTPPVEVELSSASERQERAEPRSGPSSQDSAGEHSARGHRRRSGTRP